MDEYGQARVNFSPKRDTIYTMYIQPSKSSAKGNVGGIVFFVLYANDKALCKSLNFNERFDTQNDYIAVSVEPTNLELRHATSAGTTFSVTITEPIDIVNIVEENATLTKRLNDLETRLNAVYFAPGMPGYLMAEEDFTAGVRETDDRM